MDTQDHTVHAIGENTGGGGDGLVLGLQTNPAGGSHGIGTGDNVAVTTTAVISGGRGGHSKSTEIGQEVLGRWFDILSGHGDLVRPTVLAATYNEDGDVVDTFFTA